MSGKARWSLRNIYLYLVCLITLIMIIVAAVNGVRAIVELVYPDPGGYYMDRPVVVDETGKETVIDEEVLQEERDRQQASERRWSVLSLVTNVAMLAIAGPLYLYHWRKIETEPVADPDEPVVAAR